MKNNEIESTDDWMLSGVLWKMCNISVQTYAVQNVTQPFANE